MHVLLHLFLMLQLVDLPYFISTLLVQPSLSVTVFPVVHHLSDLSREIIQLWLTSHFFDFFVNLLLLALENLHIFVLQVSLLI
jgi:hypothetical protein